MDGSAMDLGGLGGPHDQELGEGALVLVPDHRGGDGGCGAGPGLDETPKKRAETWSSDEIRTLISFRRETECYFNTSKTNRHLWDQISARMKALGFDRSANMCIDKWRNLLKEHKKAKVVNKKNNDTKIATYKDLEELLGERKTKSIKTGTNAANGGGGGGAGCPSAPSHKYIHVKAGPLERRIGIDASDSEIRTSLRACFGLRNPRRAFWLEDELGTVRVISREMPTGGLLNLVLDPGVPIKICEYDENGRLGASFDKVLYSEDELKDFLQRREWQCLREVGGYRDVECIEDLNPGGVYQRGGMYLGRPEVQMHAN